MIGCRTCKPLQKYYKLRVYFCAVVLGLCGIGLFLTASTSHAIYYAECGLLFVLLLVWSMASSELWRCPVCMRCVVIAR